MSPGEIASKVEGSDAGGAFYDAHREEAQAIIDSNAQLANSFATISSNKSIGEGDLFSRIAMERMTGTKVSKSA
jgi:hypothetical protein